TMSGCSFSTMAMASSPLEASPTTSMSSAMSRYLRRPWRTREWSSAMRTLMLTPRSSTIFGSTSVSCILEVVGIPGEELQPRGLKTSPSEAGVPAHEQRGEDPEERGGCGHHEVVRDPPPLGEVGEAPVDGEDHGQ